MAARLNAEAASLLGTMYASGHCVGQNLAPAYHWYARALHRDPANTRYKSDLEVLWNQMTPAAEASRPAHCALSAGRETHPGLIHTPLDATQP